MERGTIKGIFKQNQQTTVNEFDTLLLSYTLHQSVDISRDFFLEVRFVQIKLLNNNNDSRMLMNDKIVLST